MGQQILEEQATPATPATDKVSIYPKAGGGAYKISDDGVEHQLLTNVGDQTIPTINLTGGQIVFPSTAVPSAGVNTLDDYEEGSWTPAGALVTPGNSSNASQIGRYTIIGDLITCVGSLVFTKGTGTGSFTVTGLPVAAANLAAHYNPVALSLDSIGAANEVVQGIIVFNTSTITLTMAPQGTGAATVVDNTDLGTEASIRIMVTYRVS